MSEAVFDYFLHNGEVKSTEEFDSLYSVEYPSVYEVIRIIDGIPLFLEEHYERLTKSTAIMGYKLKPSYDEIRNSIIKMTELNNILHFNIKIVINNLDKEDPDEFYFFIKSEYPTDEMYVNGVDTILFKAIRENPQAKVINQNLRDKVNKLINEKKCYEALLVDNNNEITEGSRSNVFFIIENQVYTSPAEGVLLGITRQRILRLCKENNIKVMETPMPIENLDIIEGAFISGTSPKVLPIHKIGDTIYSPNNKLLRRVIEIYDKAIEDYIKEHK